jgi:hypothetical protein
MTEVEQLPARVWVDRLGEQILVVAEPQGAIALSPIRAVEIARDLLNEAFLRPAEN